MIPILNIPTDVLLGQLLLGLINGSFYAILSLGLSVIFGLLNIINFTHGAQYMMGAFVSWMLLTYFGIGYWPALLISPVVVGITGVILERFILRRIYDIDHIYGFLLTYGVALVIESIFRGQYGVSGQPYRAPALLSGVIDLDFMVLPIYRLWVVAASIAVCAGTWLIIEKTRLGSYLRAATERPVLVRAFGVNVPRMIMITYGFGVALAAFAGVLAAPLYQVSSIMGSNLMVVVFAVVVIGGMGSIGGSIVAGFGLGILEGLTKVFYPPGSNLVVFVAMILILTLRPAGLFGKAR
ncbi:branched-chain amino acid ABC transporter permease [Corticibacterium sp. UT-5YL-CI-8]|nr:branched-chain amino acid ABC transporter permease [Tianweitania sp. UT-5YL-CI-8]